MQNELGIFGKIPAHGDFIERNLQRSFALQWDDWLQSCVASSREQLGDQWLEIYLTSPIWRFVLSMGAVDNQAWAGILVPSVDSVGRYYPLTLVQPIPGDSNPFQIQADNDHWFCNVEDLALDCLQNGLNADELMSALSRIDSPIHINQDGSSQLIKNGQVSKSFDNHIVSTYAGLLHQTLSLQYESQSLWWGQGSQKMKPTLVRTSGLPTCNQFSAFLDGDWKKWNGQ